MNKNIFAALNEQFYIDCEVIETKYEYPQYTGVEKWIIITDLTEEELNSKYAEQIAPLRPFVVIGRSFGDIRKHFRRNEDKFAKRAVINNSVFDFSDATEEHHTEIATPDAESMYIKEETYAELRKAIMALEATQKRRIILYFFYGFTYKEIADIDDVSIQAVAKYINKAIENLKKIDFRG